MHSLGLDEILLQEHRSIMPGRVANDNTEFAAYYHSRQ